MEQEYLKILSSFSHLDPIKIWDDTNQIKTDLPWLKLSVPAIPVDEIASEFQTIEHLCVDHRDYENNLGWRSICLHGIAPEKTNYWTTYGYTECPIHTWTSIADHCPITKKWIEDSGLANSYQRIRFMLLEPGGYIDWHVDTDIKRLGPVNISITQPLGCEFEWQEWGVHPWKPAEAYLMNVGYRHRVVNHSDQQRLHIICDVKGINRDLVTRSIRESLQRHDLYHH